MVAPHRHVGDLEELDDNELLELMSVVKEINEPRVASLKGKLAAKKAEIPKWNADELKADRSKSTTSLSAS